MPEVQLVIVDGPNVGREFQLTGSLVVGRDASAGIVLEDAEASRRHASVTATATGAEVEDLGSTNGTFVNGERVAGKRELGAGDKLRIGTTVLEVRPIAQATKIASTIPDEGAGKTMVASTIPEGPPEPSALTGDAAPEDDFPTVAPEPAPEPAAAAPPPAPEPPPAPAPPPAAVPPPPAAAPPPPPPPAAPPAFGPPPQAPAPEFGPPPGPPGFPPPPAPGQAVQPVGYAAPGTGFTVRNPVTEWLLCIFVPFYSAIWYYRLQKNLGEWSGGRIHTNPGLSVVAVTLGAMILVPPFVSYAGTMGRVRTAQQMAGLQPTVGFWGFFGRLFLLGYGYKWVQEHLNELATRQPIQ